MEFPPILVINLDSRQDRWAKIQESFSHWPARLERVSAVKAEKGWMGCRDSHIKCINIAKERGYPWVLVLEDDCLPTPTSFTQFSELLPTLWESLESLKGLKTHKSWNVFLGGVTNLVSQLLIQPQPPLFHVKGYTTHFCLYPAESYDTIISVALSRPLPFDLNLKHSPLIKEVCTTPFLAVQAPGVSDIESGKVQDYKYLFSHAERVLANILKSTPATSAEKASQP